MAVAPLEKKKRGAQILLTSDPVLIVVSHLWFRDIGQVSKGVAQSNMPAQKQNLSHKHLNIDITLI